MKFATWYTEEPTAVSASNSDLSGIAGSMRIAGPPPLPHQVSYIFHTSARRIGAGLHHSQQGQQQFVWEFMRPGAKLHDFLNNVV